MSKKDNKIRELEEKVAELEYDVAFLEERVLKLSSVIKVGSQHDPL